MHAYCDAAPNSGVLEQALTEVAAVGTLVAQDHTQKKLLIFEAAGLLDESEFPTLFMKKFTARRRVRPPISASVSCDTLGSFRWDASSHRSAPAAAACRQGASRSS